jgi:hypothetical protein
MSWIIFIIIILRFLLPWIDQKMQERITRKKYKVRHSIDLKKSKRRQQQSQPFKTELEQIQAKIAVVDTGSKFESQERNTSVNDPNKEQTKVWQPESAETAVSAEAKSPPTATVKDRDNSLIDEDMNNSVSQEIQQRDRDRIAHSELLIQQAKSTIDRDTSNPFDSIDLLSQAISLYQQSYLLVNKQSCISAIEGLQLEIDRRHQFQSLM